MPTRMIRPEELDAFFTARQNLLFIGKHGVGKTSKIKACFEKHGLVRNSTYLYFSASTLDPWVDLIGVPKETKGKDGVVSLDLVRPKALATGMVEAIFFDELNRSPKKVRNAVMELLQFKSINGLEFPNLKVIWAAINPDTEEDIYDVEKLDPAQKGRFHAWIDIPYECDKEFFVSKYGMDVALPALEWWNALPEAVRNEVDPRRLDYALDAMLKDLPLEFILPASSNISKLLQSIKMGSVQDKLNKFMSAKDTSGAKLFLANANNFDAAMKYVIADQKMMEFFLPISPKERLAVLLSKEDKVRLFMTSKKSIPAFLDIIRDVMIAQENEDLIKKLRHSLGGNIDAAKTAQAVPGANPAPAYAGRSSSGPVDYSFLEILKFSDPDERAKSFDMIKRNITLKIKPNDAVRNLGALTSLVSAAFPSALLTPQYDKLTGVINTCLLSMADGGLISPDNMLEDLLKNFNEFKPLFDKLTVANLHGEIVRQKPAK